MNLFAFFNDTPFVPIGLIYTGSLGYFAYIGFRLFLEDFF